MESVAADRTRESLSDIGDIERRAGVNTASPGVAIDQCEIVAKQVEWIPDREKMIPVPRMW